MVPLIVLLMFLGGTVFFIFWAIREGQKEEKLKALPENRRKALELQIAEQRVRLNHMEQELDSVSQNTALIE